MEDPYYPYIRAARAAAAEGDNPVTALVGVAGLAAWDYLLFCRTVSLCDELIAWKMLRDCAFGRGIKLSEEIGCAVIEADRYLLAQLRDAPQPNRPTGVSGGPSSQ